MRPSPQEPRDHSFTRRSLPGPTLSSTSPKSAENWGSDMTFDDTLRGTQERALRDVLMGSRLVVDALNGLSGCALPNWLLSAGVIAQTVWNAAHGFDACYGIRDLDVVYFDPDTRRNAEDAAAKDVTSRLGGLGFQVDVKNQARVHKWYPDRFGASIRPYESIEDALRSWPTTATALGVSVDRGELMIRCGFGLTDLLDLVVRPNRVQVPPEIYERKVARWSVLWPKLSIRSWQEGVGIEGERVVRIKY